MLDDLLIYFPYIGILLLLILGGIGLPFPEDLTLILAGQLAFSEGLQLPLLLVVCFMGVISMDVVLFHIGKKYVRILFKYRFFRRIFTHRRRIQVKRQFSKYGNSVVFVARFIGGFRAPVFITAGMLKMSYIRFLFWDVLASLFSVPLFVFGSYYLGQQFETIAHGLATKITLGLMGMMGIVFVFVIASWYWESKKDHIKHL